MIRFSPSRVFPSMITSHVRAIAAICCLSSVACSLWSVVYVLLSIWCVLYNKLLLALSILHITQFVELLNSGLQFDLVPAADQK